MGEKKTWGNFIKKLVVQVITVFVFWAVGSNFVHVIGRSKPNKGNRYSPGHWDWPHNCNCYPYFDASCLNKNDLAETKQWIEKHSNISHDNISVSQNKPQKQTVPPIDSDSSVFVNKDKSPIDTSSKNEIVSTEYEKSMENVLKGGGRKWVNKQFRKFNSKKRKQRGGAVPEENKQESGSNLNSMGTNSPEKDSEEPESIAKSMLGLKEKLQKRILSEIFNDYDDFYVDGYGGESVVGPDPNLVVKWEAKNNKEATNPILRAFIQTRNESVAKAESWLSEAESKVQNNTWTEDYQLDDPVPQTLGPTGKLYLYTPLSTDEYGFPYNLQKDGRVSTSSKGTCVRDQKTKSYSDGTLFGNPDLNTKDALKSAVNSQKKKGQVGGFQIGGTYEETMSASANKFGSNEEMKRDIANEKLETIEMNKKKEIAAREQEIGESEEAFKKIKQQKRRGKKGEEKDKTLGGEGLSEEIPVPDMPEGILEAVYNFAMGGWIKLFTDGAPDIFGWVQEKSCIFHRWFVYTALRFLATFYSGKPTGLAWVYIAFLLHIGPITIISSLLPQLLGIISYIYTFLQYYLYGITKDNHLLTGITWAGNFLFLPIILAIVTGWIPILNIITVPLSILLSFLPSLQTYVIPGITSFFQTLRSVLYLAVGQIFTPTGSQHYLGNILNIDRFRGLFILELVLIIIMVILNHMPVNDNIKTGAALGVGGGWLLTQIYFFIIKRSGWNALFGR